ncbi:16S rRNA (uracil(1498)-N(3))-methyltransferase [Synechocystis sp. LKSZ1]|uniref:16S rRNA (uracil(1498)-N(3))-methyltransferase n=1 Tax=Synechocystis sp. LKSZ1 TaxID=3144951 RepID=UPI00336BCDA6
MVYRLVIDQQQIMPEGVCLTPEQAHYVQRVLRLRHGDHVLLMDGQGSTWLGQLTPDHVQLLQTVEAGSELTCAVTLWVALPKGNGFEEIIRPCTELGVQVLQPLLTERTLPRPSPHKRERWQRIATEAAEQAERQWVPRILDPCSLDQALATLSPTLVPRYLCVTRRACLPFFQALPTPPPAQVVIATGPEGGWTETEITHLLAANFQPVSLGPSILRAITAPTVALAQFTAFLETHSSPGQDHATSHC